MKKITLLILFSISLNGLRIFSQNVFFDDPNLESALISKGYDADNDGFISYTEAGDIFDLDISGLDLFSLGGLEACSGLFELNCSNNNIMSSYVLEQFEYLSFLNCSDNLLMNLDLSQFNFLMFLDCSNNPLTSLIIDDSGDLFDLNCNNTELTYLYLKNNTSLDYVYIEDIPSLKKVCVWSENIEEEVTFYTTGSENFIFSTDCCPTQVNTSYQVETCHNSRDASIQINVIHGNNPFQYSIDMVNFQSNNTFDSLQAGIYTFYVKDNGNCINEYNDTIPEPSNPKLKLIDNRNICSYDTLVLDAGNEFDTYKWSNDSSSMSIKVSGGGMYYVTTTDGVGCVQIDSVYLNEVMCNNIDPDITCYTKNWQISYGGTEYDKPKQIISDRNMNIYSGGNTNSSSVTYGGITKNNPGYQSVIVAKTDSLGNEEWLNFSGSSATDDFGVIEVGLDGMIYFSMSIGGNDATIFGNSITGNNGTYGSFVFAKMHPDGTVEWIKQNGVPSSTGTRFIDLVFDQDTNMYALCWHGSSSFNYDNQMSLTENTGGGLAVLKLDKHGDPLWIQNITEHSVFNYNGQLAVDDQGNVYVTSCMEGETIYFTETDSLNTSGKMYDVFLVKYNTNGGFEWAKSYGGIEGTTNCAVAVDSLGDIYIGTSFASDIFTIEGETFISSNSNNFSYNIIFAKFSSSGDFYWAKQIKNGHCTLLQMETKHNNIYLAAKLNGSNMYYDNVLYSGVPSNAIISCTDHGDIRWYNEYNHGNYFTLDGHDNIIGIYSDGDMNVVSFKENEIIKGKQYYFETCKETPVHIDAGRGYDQYIWSNGYDEQVLDISISAEIYLKRKNNNGCSSNTDTINVLAHDLPIIYLGPDTLIDAPDTLILKADTGFSKYQWSDGTNDFTHIQVIIKDTCGFDLEYTVTVTDSNSCRNSDTILISSKPITGSMQSDTICIGDSIFWQGSYYKSQGLYTNNYITSEGCDSIVYLHLNVTSYQYDTLYETTCNEFESPSGNHTWNVTGIHHDTIELPGCDSIFVVNLIVNKPDTSISLSNDSILAKETNESFQWLNCDGEMSILPDETNSFFMPSVSGNYAVEVKKGECIDTSRCVYLDILTETEQNNFDEIIKIYPNPTTGDINIGFEKIHPYINVQLINAQGKIISKKLFSHTRKIKMDIDGNEGLYFIKIIDNKHHKAVFKIIKKINK